MNDIGRAGDAGVSLIEVLVSLAIFAIIGVAGLGVLNTVARTGERTEGRVEHLADIDRAFLIIRRDLLQMRGTSVTLDQDAFRFVREAEGEPVAVAYLQDEDALVRRIERPSATDVDQRILAGVATASWQLLDREGRWHSVWPPDLTSGPVRPQGAEMMLSVADDAVGPAQTITRLFVLAAGQGR